MSSLPTPCTQTSSEPHVTDKQRQAYILELPTVHHKLAGVTRKGELVPHARSDLYHTRMYIGSRNILKVTSSIKLHTSSDFFRPIVNT